MFQSLSFRGAIYCVLLLPSLIGLACSKAPDKSNDPLAVLRPFLDLALKESVYELGSTEHRWEQPYVTQELILLVEMDIARGKAFREGLQYDRNDPPILRPPTPRSYWLPIRAEGWYSYQIDTTRQVSDTQMDVVIRFHNHFDVKDETGKITAKTDPKDDQLVTYDMTRSSGDWRVFNVREPVYRFNLRAFLRRAKYMGDDDK